MGRSPLGRARLVATLGGIVLLIVMFLPWFGLGGPGIDQAQQVAEQSGTGEADVPSANAFEAFDFIDLLLVAAAVATIAPAVAFLVAEIEPPPVANALVAGLGILATLFVIYRLIDPPTFVSLPPQAPGFEIDVTRKVGAFLGLIAAAAVGVGGALATREQRWAGRPGRRAEAPTPDRF
jgi:hypothetical protein